MAKKKKTMGQRWRQFKRNVKIRIKTKQMDGKHPATQRCRIGLLMLLAQSWNSYETLYRAAMAHPQTDIRVYVLPEQEEKGLNVNRYEDALRFFEKRGIDVVPLYDVAANRWKSPDCIDVDYLFYDKPYMDMYPTWLHPDKLIYTTKMCYIPYGFLLTDQKPLLDNAFRKDFFKYIHTFFPSCYLDATYGRELFRSLGVRKHYVMEFGYPRLDVVETSGKSMADGSMTVEWTPRWTIPGTNLNNCTAYSSFLEFKDRIPERAIAHGDEHWILRPHPLAFDNYVRYGLMTEVQVADYRRCIDEMPNAEFDKDPDYRRGFERADVLVTDFTSLIIEYIASGKPVVYCGDMDALCMDELKAVVYHAHGWEQVEARLDALRAGEDPKAERRRAYADGLRGNGALIGEKILNYIVSDFYKTKNKTDRNE